MQKQSPAIRFMLFFFLAFTVNACMVPANKDSYLENFEQFIRDVEKNGEKFTHSDWKWANKKFTRYTGEFYDKFRDELTMEEKIEVTMLKGRYLAAKGTSQIGRVIQENLEEGIDNLGKDVKKYLDENLDEDLEEISKGAREIGDSAVKVMEDVLNELKKKKE